MNKTAEGLAGIVLAGSLALGCGTRGERIISIGTIDGNKIKIIQIDKRFDRDSYKFEIYDKEGNLRLECKSPPYFHLAITYDDKINFILKRSGEHYIKEDMGVK